MLIGINSHKKLIQIHLYWEIIDFSATFSLFFDLKSWKVGGNYIIQEVCEFQEVEILRQKAADENKVCYTESFFPQFFMIYFYPSSRYRDL